jgi:hypothetical protein
VPPRRRRHTCCARWQPKPRHRHRMLIMPADFHDALIDELTNLLTTGTQG